jgi:hypothetical protein
MLFKSSSLGNYCEFSSFIVGRCFHHKVLLSELIHLCVDLSFLVLTCNILTFSFFVCPRKSEQRCGCVCMYVHFFTLPIICVNAH